MEFTPITPAVPQQATATSLETESPWDGPVIRAVCLDIDDTLVDFTAACRSALTRLIGRADMWPVWERVTDAHVAMVVDGVLDYEVMHHRRTASFLAELGVACEHADIENFERRRRGLARAGWRLYDDVVPCLEWLLAAGVRIAAVTNASGRHQRTKLAELGLAGLFDHVAVAGELGMAKPDPMMFEAACRELGAAPAETAHVGDRLDTDARGAHDAGLWGVWLCRSTRGDVPTDHASPHSRTPDGVHVIGTLAELPELLVTEFVRVGTPVAGENPPGCRPRASMV